jgi:sulfur relay (sulfurtransferase) complex TusBCD TusD component (DsrE family)
MHKRSHLVMGLLLLGLPIASTIQAEEDKSMGLFINLTTFEIGRAGHALHFADKQMARGHPVTLFLNDQAVLLAAESTPMAPWSMSGKTLRDMLADLMQAGAKVIVCRMCATLRGVGESDLVSGAMLGNPERVGESLFDPRYQTITW